jgi:hypothetical protein
MSATLTRTIPHDVVIDLTGDQVAALFWDLDATDQARFFNWLDDCERLPFQLQAVTNSSRLQPAGRSVMRTIGDYASPNP